MKTSMSEIKYHPVWVKATTRLPAFKQRILNHLEERTTPCLIKASGLHFDGEYNHHKNAFITRFDGDLIVWNESVFEKFNIHWFDETVTRPEPHFMTFYRKVNEYATEVKHEEDVTFLTLASGDFRLLFDEFCK